MQSKAPEGARLTIAISTLGARAGGITLPAPQSFVRYLILVQRPEEAPQLPERSDVQVVPLDSIGLSKSRNAALDLAETPFLMVADDDTELDLAGIETILARLEAAPDLAFVTGELVGRRRKAGPLRLWNAGRTNSSEMLLRLAPLKERGIRFDECFGLGTPYPMGEEYIFIADALAAGLRGRHVSITVADHPDESTGEQWTDPALLAARLAVLRRVFGWRAPLVRLAYAWKHRRALAQVPGGVLGFVLGREG